MKLCTYNIGPKMMYTTDFSNALDFSSDFVLVAANRNMKAIKHLVFTVF